jgi:hypothetical protein
VGVGVTEGSIGSGVVHGQGSREVGVYIMSARQATHHLDGSESGGRIQSQ